MEFQPTEINIINKEQTNHEDVNKTNANCPVPVDCVVSDEKSEPIVTPDASKNINVIEEKAMCCEIIENGENVPKTDVTVSVDSSQNIAVNGLSDKAHPESVDSVLIEKIPNTPNQDLQVNVDSNTEEIISEIEKSILNAIDGNIDIVPNEVIVENSVNVDDVNGIRKLDSDSNTEKSSVTNEISNSETVENNVQQKCDAIKSELNSDESIKSVIKDIIDALQIKPPAEILPQVSEVNPPEGFLSELEWKKRETVLLVRIAKLEEDERIKQEAWQMKMKAKCDENEMVKAKLKTLEIELRAVCGKPGKNNDMVTKIKKQHEDLLTKARGMIFEKTKLVKNQELKIEALTSQVASLKDMVAISKDMLNIRNMECKHLTDRMEAMDLRIQAEKERQNLVQKKLESGNKLNEELKNEYLKQVELFKCLKQRYEEKVAILERNQKEPAESSGSSQNQ